MEKEVYDNVGIISVALNKKLKELEACQKEKEKILKEIEELQAKEQLEKNYPSIKEKMDKNLKRFKKVVDDIKKINTIEKNNKE